MPYASKLFSAFGAPIVSQFNGQTITGYVAGNRQSPVAIEKALVDLSYELGTNEVPGDGPLQTDSSGERERRTGHLGILRTLVEQHGIKDDWSFWIDGELWFIQRRDAKDNEGGAYVDYRITSVNPSKSRHPQIQPSRPVRSR